MKQYQLKFCNERALNIYHEKREKLKRQYTKPGKSLSYDEKIKLINSGKVKIRKKITVPRYGSLDAEHIFDFSKYEYDSTTDFKRLDPALDKLKAQYEKLTAEITLGDEAIALKMLEQFAK